VQRLGKQPNSARGQLLQGGEFRDQQPQPNRQRPVPFVGVSASYRI
jgi:hypothetical protein